MAIIGIIISQKSSSCSFRTGCGAGLGLACRLGLTCGFGAIGFLRFLFGQVSLSQAKGGISPERISLERFELIQGLFFATQFYRARTEAFDISLEIRDSLLQHPSGRIEFHLSGFKFPVQGREGPLAFLVDDLQRPAPRILCLLK